MPSDLRTVGVIEVDPVESRKVQQFATLEDVVRWPHGTIIDVIVQDEFTHDVIVRESSLTRDATAYIVFDTT